jgi:hypothetical protein
MAVLESARGDSFGNKAANYLLDWARRTGNVASMSSYFVEARLDGSTGLEYFYIRPTSDLATSPSNDDANPAAINLSTNDPQVAAEVASIT